MLEGGGLAVRLSAAIMRVLHTRVASCAVSRYNYCTKKLGSGYSEGTRVGAGRRVLASAASSAAQRLPRKWPRLSVKETRMHGVIRSFVIP
jgi:hypothetical protein